MRGSRRRAGRVRSRERRARRSWHEAVGTVDAVVFAAGAGAGSGPDRKWTMDYGGAAKLIVAAKANGIDRYVMISSMGRRPRRAGRRHLRRLSAGQGEGRRRAREPAGSATRSCAPTQPDGRPGEAAASRAGDDVGRGEDLTARTSPPVLAVTAWYSAEPRCASDFEVREKGTPRSRRRSPHWFPVPATIR